MNPTIQNPLLINCTAGSTTKLNNLWLAHTVAALKQSQFKLNAFNIFRKNQREFLLKWCVCFPFRVLMVYTLTLWLSLHVAQEQKLSCIRALHWFGKLPLSRGLWSPVLHPAVTAFIMELLTLSVSDRKWGKSWPCYTVQHNVGRVTAVSRFTLRGLKQKQVMN